MIMKPVVINWFFDFIDIKMKMIKKYMKEIYFENYVEIIC